MGTIGVLEIFTLSSVVFRSLGGLKILGEKNPGKIFNVYWRSGYVQTLLSCFSFSPVLNQRQ